MHYSWSTVGQNEVFHEGDIIKIKEQIMSSDNTYWALCFCKGKTFVIRPPYLLSNTTCESVTKEDYLLSKLKE
jgi:hypothetical protein